MEVARLRNATELPSGLDMGPPTGGRASLDSSKTPAGTRQRRKPVPEADIESRVARCVSEALGEVNSLRAEHEQLADSAETVLVGDDGALDSLGLVNLAVALEGAIERDFGQAVGLVGDLLAAEDSDSFRTVGLLVAFASERVATQAA